MKSFMLLLVFIFSPFLFAHKDTFHKHFKEDGAWNTELNIPTYISNKEIILRPITSENPEHKDLLFVLFASPENMALFADRKIKTEEEILKILNRHTNTWHNLGMRGGFAIYKNEVPVGLIGIGLSDAPGIGEFYCLIDHNSAGKGVGRAAFSLIMNEWASFLHETQAPIFQDRPLDAVFATVSLDNPKSIHLLLKNNFENPSDEDIRRFRGTCIMSEEQEVELEESNGLIFLTISQSRHGIKKALLIKHLQKL
jgi:RimJ/RimL family protein N-acetyltransferase